MGEWSSCRRCRPGRLRVAAAMSVLSGLVARAVTVDRRKGRNSNCRVAFVGEKGRLQMRLFIVVVAIVLFLTGCSGGDGTDDSPDASGGEPTLNAVSYTHLR